MYRRLVEDGIIPILDVGLIEAVKERRLSIVAAVTGFDDAEVVLADGHRLRPDAVIAATGFRRGLEPLVGAFGVLRDNGLPAVHGPQTDRNAPDLYFIGYSNPLSGNLRELGIDSQRIVRDIARRRGSPTAVSPVGSPEDPGDQGDRDQHHHAGGGELEGALRDPRTKPVSQDDRDR
jgi:hypothetical protein